VTNFLGESATKSVEVTKLDYPAPEVSIQGAHPRHTTYSDELVLRADAELPEMSCVDSSLSNARMSYVWREVTGKYAGSLSTTNPRVLRVAKRQLLATESYEFKCSVALTDNPTSNNSATVEVVVNSQPVEAVIAGGAERVSGTDQSLVLDASYSVDPDMINTSFSYAWSCTNATSGAVCNTTAGGRLELAPNATVSVPANSLTPGTYEFEVFVSKPDGRNDTTASTVVITTGSPPMVRIATLASEKYNPAKDSYLQLSGTATSSSSVKTRALVTKGIGSCTLGGT
jgi:hypothetical protein